ncbi:MAG: phage tail tape-measure protein [Ancylobacter novellus]|uniref:Phage tail tape-measure protein n=1 Tax=Ancylobacter novellus TaxID=921 RepID=A0A2W5SX45_ANCNO|nr:MAG: phage tail tape-measure protein [Ancylobacter novellus]
MATVTDRSTKRQLDAGTAADRVRQKYDEQHKLTQLLAREHRSLAAAVDAGRMSSADYVHTLELMHAKYGIVTDAQAAMNRQLEQEVTLRTRVAQAERALTSMGRATVTPALNESANDRLRNLGATVARNEAAAVAAVAQQYEQLNAQAERALRSLGKMAASPVLNERANGQLRNMGEASARAEAAAVAAVAREYERYIGELVRARQAQDDLARARAATAQGRINQQLGVRDDFGTDARAADISAVGDQIQAIREKYVPLLALQRQYKEALDEINQSAKVGILTEAQRAEAVARTKAVFADQVVAIRAVQEAGGRVGFAAHDLANLSYQLNDVFTMLAMGAPPLQIVASQLGQIYQILASQQGGVVGGFKALGATIGGLVSPATLSAAALVGVGVAATAAYASWIAGEKQLQAAVQGRGRETGATAAELMSIAAAAADAADISQGAARDIAAAFAATGRVGTGLFVDLTTAAANYASITSGDVVQAGQDLAESFADPAKGAEDLNRKLNFLDDTTLQYIRQLSAANRQSEAQALLLQRLTAVLPSAEQRLNAIGRAWKAVANSASDAWAAIGQGVNDSLSVSSGARALAQAQQVLDSIPDLGALTAIPRRNAQAEIDRLSDELETARRQSVVAQNDAQRNRVSVAGGEQAAFQAALKAGTGDIQAQEAALQGVTNQIGAMTDAYGKLLPQAEIVRREQELQNAVTLAQTPADRAAAQARLERYRAEAEGADDATVSARANAAATQEMVQAQVQLTRATRDRLMAADESIRAQQLEIQLIGKTAGQVAELRANYEAEADLRRQAAETGVQASEQELAALRAKNAELGRSVDLANQARLQADIQFERDQLGRSPMEQQIASTLRGAGLEVDLSGANAAALRLNATLALTKDIATSADLIDGENAMDSLQNAAKRLLGTLVDLAAQNVIAGMFGNAGTGGAADWLTGIVGSFLNFGGASTGGATSTGRYAGPLAGGGAVTDRGAVRHLGQHPCPGQQWRVRGECRGDGAQPAAAGGDQ